MAHAHLDKYESTPYSENISVKSARLPLPENGFKITSGAISLGMPKRLKNGDKKFINAFDRLLAEKSSVRINIVTR